MRHRITHLGLVAILVLLAAAPASASASHRRAKLDATIAKRDARLVAAHEPCALVVQAPRGIGHDLLGEPAYEIRANLTCPTSHWNDVRLCPQQLIDGTWQFVSGAGGWSVGAGTCRDADWWDSSTTGMSSQFTDTPGQQYRAYARAWVTHDGVEQIETAVSAPWLGQS